MPTRVKSGFSPNMQQSKSTDRPLAGVVLTIAFCIIIPFSDALAKVLTGQVPLLTILIARFLGQAVMSAPALANRRARLGWRLSAFAFLRTVLQLGSLGLFYVAFRYLQLADAIAISFISPFLVLLMGKLFLGEQVGPRRIAACGVGFLGTMMVIQPSFAEVGLPALLPLGGALFFAFYSMATRQLVRVADPAVAQGISGVHGVLLLVLVSVLAGPTIEDARLVVPSVSDAWMLVGIGIIGSGAHLIMTWALRFAPAATLAPIQYLEIPFATLIGWIFFHEFPNAVASAGIVVIMGAGLYIVHRERVLARERSTQAAAEARRALAEQVGQAESRI